MAETPLTIEPATSGRAKCRGCKQVIGKDELRFGERLPNPFADGDMTIWFHLDCAAFRRPASLAEVIAEHPVELPGLPAFEQVITQGLAHDRATRIAGVGIAPSGRARCRECKEPIVKGDFRIALEFFEEGMFNAAGYIHPKCASTYFGTTDIMDRVRHFNRELDEPELLQLGETLA